MTDARYKKKKTWKLVRMILADLILLLCMVGAFLYFYVFREEELTPTALSTPTPQPVITAEITAAPEIGNEAAEPAVAQTPEPEPEISLLNGKFSEFFTDGEVISSEDGYASDKVAVVMNMVQTDTVTYYVADLYIKDITSLRTVIYKDCDSKRYMETIDMARQKDAIVAISGDFYAFRKAGLVIRNGIEWRKSSSQEDVCVLYYDGTMETYGWRDAYNNLDEIYARGPYQAWCFGPRLLDEDGKALTKFNSTLSRVNPRSAIGYYEPGHYCFILVDGRQKGYSVGMTFEELAATFEALGCKAAYNLDGGETAVMTYLGDVHSKPCGSGTAREVSDIIMVGEPLAADNAE